MPDRKFSLQTLIALRFLGMDSEIVSARQAQPRFFGRLCEVDMVGPAFSIGWAKAARAPRKQKWPGRCPATVMLRVSCVSACRSRHHLYRRAESRLQRTSWKDRWRVRRRPGKAAWSHGRSPAWCADQTSAREGPGWQTGRRSRWGEPGVKSRSRQWGD